MSTSYFGVDLDLEQDVVASKLDKPGLELLFFLLEELRTVTIKDLAEA
jgi:hypothetical protein